MGSYFPALVATLVVFAPIALVIAYLSAPCGRDLLDLVALVAPPIAFFVIGCFRSELRLGFALVIWPILLLAFMMYLVAIKIIVAQNHPIHDALFSKLTLCAGTLLAAGLALVVPQWLE